MTNEIIRMAMQFSSLSQFISDDGDDNEESRREETEEKCCFILTHAHTRARSKPARTNERANERSIAFFFVLVLFLTLYRAVVQPNFVSCRQSSVRVGLNVYLPFPSLLLRLLRPSF